MLADGSAAAANTRQGFHETPGFALAAFFGWLGISAGWWALAFARLPVSSEWLERARGVCFGMTASGLPDTSGWLLLVLGPLSLLAFLAVAWNRESVAAMRILMGSTKGRWVVAATVVALATGLGGVATRLARALPDSADAADPNASAIWGEPLPDGYPRTALAAAELELVDQHGSTLRLADLRGRTVILTFAYAHCPTVCPQLVQTVRAASGAFADTPLAARPRVVVVTLDPWRDTPSGLPALATAWELDEALLLSGPVADVERVLADYGVPISRDPNTGVIAHPALLAILDAEGRVAYRFVSPSPRWVVDAVGRLSAGDGPGARAMDAPTT